MLTRCLRWKFFPRGKTWSWLESKTTGAAAWSIVKWQTSSEISHQYREKFFLFVPSLTEYKINTIYQKFDSTRFLKYHNNKLNDIIRKAEFWTFKVGLLHSVFRESTNFTKIHAYVILCCSKGNSQEKKIKLNKIKNIWSYLSPSLPCMKVLKILLTRV